MRKLIFIFILCVFSFNLLYSEERIFIRDYIYKAGEDDSKVSSRVKAMDQAKFLLLSEIGTYVESWVNYDVVEENNKITKDFFQQEIKTLTVGSTTMKILEEHWNGYEYYIKAQISADPNEIVQRINQTLSQRKNTAVIDSLRFLLSKSDIDLQTKNETISLLKKQIATHSTSLKKSNNAIDSLKIFVNKTEKELQIKTNSITTLKNQYDTQKKTLLEKENAVNELSKQLQTVRKQLSLKTAEEIEVKSELEAIESKIKTTTSKALSNVRIGMTPSEVRNVCGEPRSIVYCSDDPRYNYGNVWVIFESGIATIVVKNSVFNYVQDQGFYRSFYKHGIVK